MSPEKQRIAIAEACGWKLSEPVFGHDGRWRRRAYKGKSIFSSFDSSWAGGPHDVIDDWCNAPDYPADLNAMHEAECDIPPHLLYNYQLLLVEKMALHIKEVSPRANHTTN